MTDENRPGPSGAETPAVKFHEKELDLLRDAAQQLSNIITRFALLRLSLMAILVFAFANAFKQIDVESIAGKRQVLDSLGAVTGRQARHHNVDPFQDFFILRNILSEGTRSDVDYNLCGSGVKCTNCLSLREWRAVEPLLRKDSEAAKALDEHPLKVTPMCLIPAAGPADSRPTMPTADEDAPPPPPPPARPNEFDYLAFDPAVKEAAALLQSKEAEEIAKTYRDAFTNKLSLLGASLSLDLRNWFAFFPFLYILSAAYTYIQRRKLRMLQTLAAHRVWSLGRAGRPVASSDRLLFSDDPRRATAYARHPSQMLEWAYAACGVGLLVYFAYSSVPFFATLGDTDLLLLFFRIIVPSALTLLTGLLYAGIYCRRVRAKLWAEFEAGTGLSPADAGLEALPSSFLERARGLARLAGARLWLKTGSALLLCTLLLAVTTDSCGRPHPGYRLFVGKVAEGDGGRVEEAQWLPALWGELNVSDTPQADNPLVKSLLGVEQRLGRLTYRASVALAVITLGLLAYYSAGRWERFKPRLALWLLSASVLITALLVLDLYLYFLKPRLKFGLMAIYLSPLLALGLLFILRPDPAARRRLARRLLQPLADFYWPVVALSLAVAAAFGLFTYALTLFYNVGQHVAEHGVVWAVLARADEFQDDGFEKLATENLGLGLFCLLAGSLINCVGYARLYAERPRIRDAEAVKPTGTPP